MRFADPSDSLVTQSQSPQAPQELTDVPGSVFPQSPRTRCKTICPQKPQAHYDQTDAVKRSVLPGMEKADNDEPLKYLRLELIPL
jgi:hypothetical protein